MAQIFTDDEKGVGARVGGSAFLDKMALSSCGELTALAERQRRTLQIGNRAER